MSTELADPQTRPRLDDDGAHLEYDVPSTHKDRSDVGSLAHDDAASEAAEEAHERRRAETIKKVEKVLEETPAEPQQKEPPQTPQTEQGGEEDQTASGTEPSGEIPPAMLNRAQRAGMTEAFARKLHEIAPELLEDELVENARRIIEQGDRLYFQDAQPQAPAQPQGQTPAQQQQAPQGQQQPQAEPRAGEPPPLDPKEYGEEAAARDRFHAAEVNTLKSELEEMRQYMRSLASEREGNFNRWLDGQFSKLQGGSDIYGEGTLATLREGANEYQVRERLVAGYFALCAQAGVDPFSCDASMLEGAHLARHRDDILKLTQQTAQKEVVDRLRDSQGRFLSPARGSSSGPPAKNRMDTEEGRRDEMVRRAEKILGSPPRKRTY